MDTNSREINRKSSIELHAALHSIDELRNVGVAGVKAGICVYDADYRSGECIFGVAKGFDENFAQEEGEVGVAVGGEVLAEAGC